MCVHFHTWEEKLSWDYVWSIASIVCAGRCALPNAIICYPHHYQLVQTATKILSVLVVTAVAANDRLACPIPQIGCYANSRPVYGACVRVCSIHIQNHSDLSSIPELLNFLRFLFYSPALFSFCEKKPRRPATRGFCISACPPTNQRVFSERSRRIRAQQVVDMNIKHTWKVSRAFERSWCPPPRSLANASSS